jgi:hypothetical protein
MNHGRDHDGRLLLLLMTMKYRGCGCSLSRPRENGRGRGMQTTLENTSKMLSVDGFGATATATIAAAKFTAQSLLTYQIYTKAGNCHSSQVLSFNFWISDQTPKTLS